MIYKMALLPYQFVSLPTLPPHILKLKKNSSSTLKKPHNTALYNNNFILTTPHAAPPPPPPPPKYKKPRVHFFKTPIRKYIYFLTHIKH